jgi:peptidoglycan-N-acetylglucosamine deacetylase
MAGLVVLLVVAGIAAIVASADEKSPTAVNPPTTDAVRVIGHPAAAPRPRGHRSSHRAHPNSDTRAVDGVLRYTAFVASGTRRRRVIALTFDDGPGPYTPQIVQILARMRAPATFFVVGQQLGDFSAGLRDELRHGLAVGDHTENHAWLIRLSASAQYAQIRDAAVRLGRLGAPWPLLFRPPYGYYNASTLALLRRLHMLMVLWSIDPRDWLRPGARAIAQRVLSASRPGGIVELHDGGGDRSETVAALPAIIDGLHRRGYQLVTVPDLLRLDPPPHGQRLPALAGA